MSLALAALGQLISWRDRLRPASFRGVPFFVDAPEGEGGRRHVTSEFPLRDDPYTEDLGKAARRYKIAAYVIGDDYMDQRDALLSACEDFDDAATLVHPTLGERSCRAGKLRFREDLTTLGGMCTVEIEFIEDGPQASPLAGDDTASAILDAIGSLQAVLGTAYQAASLVTTDAGFVLAQAGTLLALASSALAVLPATTFGGLAPQIAAIAATPADDAATATAVQTTFSAAAALVVTANDATPPPIDPVLGLPQAPPPNADISGGLLGLASWGGTLPPIAGDGPSQAAQAQQQAATVALVQGNAVMALLTVYAQATWPDQEAATTARAALLPLLDAQSEAAANAGQDDLYRAWQATTALAMTDMIARAQALPVLANYTLPDTMPSLWLAQRLYLDPTQAAALEALNGVEHPLFMPANGMWLEAA